MGKGLKIFGVLLLILAIGCFGLYFLYGNKPSEYRVIFDTDGGSVIAEQTIQKGERVVKPEDPTKEKNDFVEWQLDGSVYDFNSVVEKDITLRAIWKAYNTFNIKVTLDNNEYVADMREGEPLNIDELKMPAKEGYKIKLYTEDNKEYDATLAISKDLVLTGKYEELQKFTVKFDTDGGSKIEDIKVTEGETIKEPATSKDGFVFDAWYLKDEKFDFKKPITENITLKAKWKDGSKITVTFNVDDKEYKTVTISENSKVTKPANPTKTGYKFVEWQLNGKAFDFNTKISSSITLTAVFEEAKTSIVKFNSDGGTAVKQQEVQTGGKATKPADPTKEGGYRFIEWQLNNKAYNFNSAVNNDITLKAKWIKTYVVTFNRDNGSANVTVTVDSGSKVTRPADPTKTDRIFEEWLYDNRTFDFSTPITKDITLVARYRAPKTFTVTFNSNGGTPVGDQSVTEGGKAARPADPTKADNSFLGWQLNGAAYDFNSVVKGDITLTASWQPTNNPDIFPTE